MDISHNDIKKKYKAMYEEDRVYIITKFRAFCIPKEIEDKYLYALLTAYVNIEDLDLHAVLQNTLSQIYITTLGDSLYKSQKSVISSCTTYLKLRYDKRKTRGEI